MSKAQAKVFVVMADTEIDEFVATVRLEPGDVATLQKCLAMFVRCHGENSTLQSMTFDAAHGVTFLDDVIFDEDDERLNGLDEASWVAVSQPLTDADGTVVVTRENRLSIEEDGFSWVGTNEDDGERIATRTIPWSALD